MDRTTVLTTPAFAALAIFVAACLLIPSAGAADDALDGPLVDLTGDLACDVAALPSAGDPLAEAIYPCGLKENLLNNGIVGFVRAGVVILSRDKAKGRPSSTVYAVSDGTELIDSADMNVGSPVGVDVTLLSPLSNSMELEIRYFGIDSWKASRSAASDGGVRFEGFGAETLTAAEQFNYRSRLMNFEIGLRPRVRAGIPLVIGFRTLQIHEKFEAWGLHGGTSMLDAASRTNNFLWGAQIGAEPYMGGGNSPLRLETILKAGIYGNAAAQQATSEFFGESLAAKRTQTAFVGEVGAAVVYQVSKMLALRGGYELLWVKGLALAPDQSSATSLLSHGASLNTSASVLYQGAMASLDFVF